VFAVSFLLVVVLRWLPPPTSAFMLQQYLLERWDGRNDVKIRYKWVNRHGISPHAALAVIAAEDQKFPYHWGFDREAIVEAWEERREGTRIRGASTISQQVAKNLFLWPGKSFVRKGIEAYFTVLIEVLWSKSRIVEVYLNIAQFGRGIFGISEASKVFFGKAPSRLSRKECALMAAALPNPLRLRIDRPSDYLRQRSDQILEEMGRMGRINLSASFLQWVSLTNCRPEGIEVVSKLYIIPKYKAWADEKTQHT
jgi:monofunctional biosynthetic peptidoglycan transglycosylase